jgi:hypothetical protein
MGSYYSKVDSIWLPGQSGKTRKIQNEIKMYNALSKLHGFDNSEYLHILICSNNRSLVGQTNSRMKNDLYTKDESDASSSDSEDEEDAYTKIEGDVFSWISGNKNNSIDANNLSRMIRLGDINMVVCCANMARFRYLLTLLNILENTRSFNKKIMIWIDEADASIKQWSKFEDNITQIKKIKKITLVSATFDSILKKYGRIKVHPFEITYPNTYHKIQDCHIIENNTLTNNAVDYLKTIFEIKKYEEMLCKPGMRLFAPGDRERKTHDAITNFLVDKGFIVAILNGTRKEIVGPNGIQHSLEKYISKNETPEEIGKLIASIYIDNNYSRYPFAITGQLCLGRGLTFQVYLGDPENEEIRDINKEFLFDFGIIPNIDNEADGTQCAWRTAGNIKNFLSYKPSTLIMTSRMKKVVIEKENIACNIASIVYNNGLTDVGKEEILLASGKLDEYNDEMKKEIPIVLNSTEDVIHRMELLSGEERKKIILRMLLEHDNKYNYLNNYHAKKVTIPQEDNSYKRHILDTVKCSEIKKKSMLDFTSNDKKINIWEAFIDIRENRIIIIIYHGASLPVIEKSTNPF